MGITGDDARDELLAIASHELRTPLTALGLQLEMIDRLIDRAAPPDELRARTAGARRALGELTALLDRLLDVTRIAAGRLALELAELDLRDVIADVCDRLAPNAERASCALAVELESVTGRWDRVRIDQIATNLLTNAIKYGAGAPVRVRLGAEGDRACLDVVDGGQGISREHVEHVFGKFVRLSAERDGLGIGLYVSRELARAHGGDIELDSAPGRGAHFRVTLPRG